MKGLEGLALDAKIRQQRKVVRLGLTCKPITGSYSKGSRPRMVRELREITGRLA